MAYSSIVVPTVEVDAFNADISVVNPTHAVRQQTANRILEWRTSGDFTSGADSTDPAFPTVNAYDDFTHEPTKPTTSSTDWYLMGRVDPATLPDFDTVAIFGHNFGATAVTVDFQVADDETFTTNLKTLASWAPAPPTGETEAPLIDYTLDGAHNIFQGVEFWRLWIRKGAAFTGAEVGEIVLSRRRQLLRGVLLPHDTDGQRSEIVDQRSRGGVNRRYTFYEGQFASSATIVSWKTAEFDVVKGWWRDIKRGKHPFIWTPEPILRPNDFYWVNWDPAVFPYPFEAALIRRINVGMLEADQPFRELAR